MTLLSFNGCSGPCITCQTHYMGPCLAAQKDDEYVYASPAWIGQYNVRIPPTEIEENKMMLSPDSCGDDYARAGANRVEKLRDLIRRLLAKLPHETRDLTVGWCAGCHAVQWCGDGQGAEPCAPDCVLQEAKAVIGEK